MYSQIISARNSEFIAFSAVVGGTAKSIKSTAKNIVENIY